MAISYIYTGEPMTDTANDDFFIAFKGSTGTDNNTINGNGGDDWVFADSSDTWIPSASYLNGSIATAFNFETLTSTWTTAENAMFGDFTVPHTTAIVEATIGQSEFFRIAIGAGQQITIDIDFASNTAIGNPRDLVVELQDSLGNVIATADDSLISQGGLGSFPSAPGSASSYDPYLTYTAPSAGIYYINVRPFGGGPGSTFTENNTFVMNVSVTGHATSASNPVQGNDIINGGDGDDALMGGGGGDTINGGIGNDTIDGRSGGDIVHGDAGDDVLYGGDGTEENIHGDEGNDTLISGGEGHYYGDAGDDVIYAGLTAGVNEILDGGTDVDTIDTTTWNGSYVINLMTGTTNFGESFINFENVVSGNGADTITGTDGANVIMTKGGIDTVTAGAGNDTVSGGADGDTLDGGAGVDILDYRTSNGAVTINLATNTASGGHASGDIISNFEGVRGSVLGDHLTGSNGPVKLYGFEGNDTLTGGNGNDVLDGGINDDVMTGGLGNDTYYVDSLGDTVNELLGEGTDTMALGFSYVLANGSAIERLATIDPLATVAIDLTGNSSANMLTGNGAANTLNGGAGADTMIGGLGNDTYVVDNVGDVVTETGVGTDTVQSTVTFTLGANVENLTLTGAAAIDGTGNTLANILTGNGAANTLIGLGGNDMLNGGAGVDTMIGGLGNDTYVVDNVGDVVTETGVGIDTVQSTVTFTLGANVENLTLTGSAAINGTGNGLANVLTGNGAANTLSGLSGNDTLNGGGGVDTMIGGFGNDIYVVDNVGDVVTENAGEGTDLIQSSIAFTLGANVENLTLTGGASIDGTGNALVNKLLGNTGNNILDGGSGADTMIGGLGNDTYVVDNVGDVVTETGAGIDLVESLKTFTLGANVENLTLTGVSSIDGTGNGLANILTGNGAANILSGLSGNDQIIAGMGNDNLFGGGGNDDLTGGTGLDRFRFDTTLNAATNVDDILDFSVADDAIFLDRDIFTGIAADGTLAASAFVNGTAAGDANDRIIYDGATGNIFYDADGNAGGAQTLFATVTVGTALTNADFFGYI